ncbi:hypothetical protein PICST_67240 [Scheffersomyces stipitis CBS 6054]|uniref:AMP-activated protein kinase glycogen-binding domain-containing protein n=1 Tax=Scheffersomyces stipitis (strain ATCC 58785 / CBS 6054 / NBRC 10063 / NRRL Y-11545) TaxID=322104 RepID=A3LR57_PICST|nr:hypothetical protein PICST_67240 [Scheffersomyces stipitis CBS 6054]ABN65678.2 hypothetical protein PICST_67240 [Scheffersomyces stipitis CBS 6054]
MPSYTYTIEWPHVNTDQIHSLQITGSFDNWSRSLPAKSAFEDGYQQVVKVDSRQKLVFKFIVNGNDWVTSDFYKTEHDDSGIANNVIEAAELTEFHEFEEEPEAAVIPVAATKTEVPEVTKEVEKIKEAKEVIPEVSEIIPVTEEVPGDSIKELAEDVVNVPEEVEAPEVVEVPEDAEPEIHHISEAPEVVSLPVKVEDDILSDLEDVKSKDQNLTQVLTSSSSFAAVSIPSSSDGTNDYEHLDSHRDIVTSAHDEGDDDQYNTPTNSLFNSAVLNKGKDTVSVPATPSSTSNKGSFSTGDTSINSRENSFASGNKPKLVAQDSDATLSNVTTGTTDKNNTANDVVEILKAPGGYPASPERSSPVDIGTSKESQGKRDTLISRFRSLFRY